MWNPKELRALIAQLAGIGFGVGGVLLLLKGIQATGKINVSSSLLSGQIESGSAGLILLFFSFFLIALPTLVGKVGEVDRPKSVDAAAPGDQRALTAPSPVEHEKRNSFRRYVTVTVGGLVATVVLMCAGDYLTAQHFSIGMFFSIVGVVIGIMSFIAVIALAIQWADGFASETETNDKAVASKSESAESS
ncbi:hypothetical protein [Paraburkholderia aspalathi]|uniref:hypothetical protein n=1 Tax=Paraburkholderia aspalathi TaxID=1324617 RepID=UPI001B06AACA|nr:hypothetical protein [Paraburkholderia aspalathi]CAE6754623.1 hypothetical protein R20943_03079 [Paraburkholderia aspalathi]